MPGPAVMVCEGDHVTVDVINHLAAEVTSLHFHGNVHREGARKLTGENLK
jgi:FtsP/CotA-like multicopper oxidase with cupredoxin domain